MPSILEQLHHRNIFRITAGYAVVGWVLIEVASIILPTFGAPAWVFQVFVAFLIMGFPIALVLAWAFGDKPEGVAPDALRLSQSNMIVDGVLVALLTILIGISGYSYFAKPRVVEVAATTQVDAEISIAVLAFRDLSQGQDHIHLAEGISEEILNALAQVPDLRVASRTTSFSFRDDRMTTAEINEVLNVAYILEGSVRISGNNMRITAQLIDTATDTHLWSDNFDRPMEDIFAVQDEVSNLILTALNAEMGTQFAELETDQGTESVEAYSAYLLGRHHMAKREAESMVMAVEAYEQAIDIDPEFADAYAGLGRAYYLNYEAWEEGEKNQPMRDALSTAISLDPDNAVAIATLSLTLMFDGERIIEAGILARRAYELAPGDMEIMMTYANYLVIVTRYRDAYFLLEEVLEMDPNFSPAFTNQMSILIALDRRELAYQLGLHHYPDGEISVTDIGVYISFASLAYATGHMETYERMRGQLQRVMQTNDIMSAGYDLWTASIDAAAGDTTGLQALVDSGIVLSLIEDAPFWSADDAGGVYLGIGELDIGFDLIEQAIHEGDTGPTYALHNLYPADPALFEHPRWAEIISMPQIHDLVRLQEAARAQGQWEPLTAEDLASEDPSELTN